MIFFKCAVFVCKNVVNIEKKKFSVHDMNPVKKIHSLLVNPEILKAELFHQTDWPWPGEKVTLFLNVCFCNLSKHFTVIRPNTEEQFN